jgi:hypothetical protein
LTTQETIFGELHSKIEDVALGGGGVPGMLPTNSVVLLLKENSRVPPDKGILIALHTYVAT